MWREGERVGGIRDEWGVVLGSEKRRCGRVEEIRVYEIRGGFWGVFEEWGLWCLCGWRWGMGGVLGMIGVVVVGGV